MSERTIVVIPGYNEPHTDLETLLCGRNGLPGLHDRGFNCVTLSPCYERLRERIDKLAEFVDDLRARGYRFPITLLGFSIGGLVARGYMRAYPHLAHDIEAIITIATPNFGLTTHILPTLASLLRIPDQALPDIALESEFLAWLNGTGGHWRMDPRTKKQFWVLDREPWLGPLGSHLYAIAGLLTTKGGEGDGVVNGDSASLGSRIPTHYIIGPHCNHMNLIGHFDLLVFLWTGFLINDAVWPHTSRAIVRFSRAGARTPVTA
jgi:pimeloyl-ACP methyl ester carboxylesterase